MRSDASVRNISLGLFGAIGDVLLSTPLLESLRMAYPEAKITYIVGSTAAPILEGLSLIDRRIIWPDGPDASRAADMRVMVQVALNRSDLTICLTRSRKLALALYATGAHIRAGLTEAGKVSYLDTSAPSMTGAPPVHGSARGILTMDWALNVPVDCEAEPRYREHRTEYFLAVATALGLRWPDPIRLHYSMSPSEREWVDQLMRSNGVAVDRHTLIGVHPGTSRVLAERRRWDIRNFAAVARHVSRDPDIRIVLLGGPDEIGKQQLFAESFGGSYLDLTGRLTLRQLAAVIERCHLLIHNDSSPLHIAGAVGTPVLGVFGYQNPKLWGPLGPYDQVVRRDIACSPCLPDDPCHHEMECIRKLDPAAVSAAIDSMLARIPRPHIHS